MSKRQVAWTEVVVGVLLVFVPSFFSSGVVVLGAAVVGVVLVVLGVRQLQGPSTAQPRPPMTHRRARILRVVGWLLVVPLIAAVIFTIVVFASTDPNEQTESIERVGAGVLVFLAFLPAVGGLVLIRRTSRTSEADDPRMAE